MQRQETVSDHGISRTRTTWSSVAWAAILFVGWAVACGKTAQRAADASAGAGGVRTDAGTDAGGVTGTGGVGIDAAAGTGGFTGAGGAGTDAGAGTGGLTGTGGAADDAGSGVVCSDDGGLCTTDVVSPADAGQDAPSAVDAALDAATPSCGNTACHSGQTCLLVMPGHVPLCEPQVDGGCPAGLVPTASCGGGYLSPQSPGCTESPPTPYCADIPDGCSDLCDCLCPYSGGGCYMTDTYMACAHP